MEPEDIVKISIHGCQIQASLNLFAAVVLLKDETTGETNLIRSFFTHTKAAKGDALQQAIQYARKHDVEAMEAEAVAPGVEPEAEATDNSTIE